MALTPLQDRTVELVESRQFIAVRPYLLELIKRFSDEGEEYKERLGPVYFYLGVSYLVEYGESPSEELLKEAIKAFDSYEEHFPDGELIINALFSRADCYRGLQQFENAAKDYAKLLTPPHVYNLRIAQRHEALRRIGECYYITQNWKAGEPWFFMLLQEGGTEEDKALGAAALLETFINRNEFSKALETLPFLVGDSPARYRLQLNVALIEAGDRLSSNNQYNEAMLIYRMVLTVEEIINWQERRLGSLKQQLDLLQSMVAADNERRIELETEVYNTEAQLNAIREVTSYTPELEVRIARTYLLTGRDWEAFWAYNRLLERYPNHANREDFLYAAFSTAATLKLGDQVVSLGESYLQDGGMGQFKNDVIVRLAEFYLQDGRVNEFFTLAQNFIEQNPGSRYAGQLIYFMGTTWLEERRYDLMIDQFSDYVRRFPEYMVLEGSLYWAGMGYLLEQRYAEASEMFERLLRQYPVGPYSEDALYRLGICQYGMQNLEGAREAFGTFIAQYPDTTLRGEAEFFMGDILGGAGELEQAIRHYNNVEVFTDNLSYIENAYFEKGRIYEATERYKDMERNYMTFIEKYGDKVEVTGAIYQLGRSRFLQGNPSAMFSLYMDAIVEHGNDPESYGVDDILVAFSGEYYKGVEQIQETLQFLRKVVDEVAFRQTLAEDRSALFDYLRGHPLIDPVVLERFYDRQFRVSLITDQAPVGEMIAEYERKLATYPEETPEQRLEIAYREADAAGKRTLAYRLHMASDKLGLDLAPDRAFTEQDFLYASPATLVWIGNRLSEFDPSGARQAFQAVMEQHEESDKVLDALLALGDLEMQEGVCEEALNAYARAQKLFPAYGDIWKAVIGQGDALRCLGRHWEAREKYQEVVEIRDWRGQPHAEALVKTGLSFKEENDFERAQAFFERTYVGHSAFPDWASRAYWESGQLLQQMGRTDEARQTYDEFLENSAYSEAPYYNQIRQARNALQ